MLHAQDVLHGLSGLRFGHPVYLFQQIGSTNDHAKQLAEGGAPEGLLIVAEEQTAGRGRNGRHWLTPPGAALAFSLILRPPLSAARLSRLTMLAGVAACEAIEQLTGAPAGLKWPNDVLLSGKKVAGILVEGALSGDALDYAVLGLGLNLSWSPDPAAVDFPATNLQAETGQAVDRLKLLRALLVRLEAWYAAVDDTALFAAWQAHLQLMGEPIFLRTPEGEWPGRAEGVEADGALLVRLDSGETQRVLAGDVHLRPALS
jgi:BirA family biotin operon repressor/biotin-[acetyl-CoA-carboxylase] ligase